MMALGGLFMEYPVNATKKHEIAIFGGGCFWCMEPLFEEGEGGIEVNAGYTGGTTENPTYEQVSTGMTDHLEAVRVSFDPACISYREVADIFWRQIDPTDNSGQFADRGPHYRTAIFYKDEEQRSIAERSKSDLESSETFSSPIVTEVRHS